MNIKYWLVAYTPFWRVIAWWDRQMRRLGFRPTPIVIPHGTPSYRCDLKKHDGSFDDEGDDE